MNRDAFDTLIAGMDTAMVIVTVSDGIERSGCLVGFHTQSSIEPPRYAIWLSKANHTYGVALRSRHLAMHLLDDGDRAVAELFGGETGDEVDKFADVDWEPGPDGVPLLAGCPNRVVVRRVALFDEGGDHACFVTEPVEVSREGPFTPLRLRGVQDIDPGHDAD